MNSILIFEMVSHKKISLNQMKTKEFKEKFNEFIMVDSIVAAETILKNMKDA